MMRIVLLTMDGDVASKSLIIVKTNKMAIILHSPYIITWTQKSIKRSWKAPRKK